MNSINILYSPIVQQIRAFKVNEKDVKLILNAKAGENGYSIFSQDFIFLKTNAEAAPTLFSLMSSIGQKFDAVICNKSDEQESYNN